MNCPACGRPLESHAAPLKFESPAGALTFIECPRVMPTQGWIATDHPQWTCRITDIAQPEEST